MEKIIEELENTKKDYYDCFSNEEAIVIREWNKAIDECINIIKKYV